MKSQALELIHCWTWFKFLPDEAKSHFADACRLMTIDKGATLYRHNDDISYIYGVVSGGFRIYVASPDGEEMTLEDVAAGAWFPHFLPQDTPVYFGNCVSTKTSTVVVISVTDFLAFGEAWPQLYRGLYNEFVARGAVTIGRIELLTFHSLNVRLAVYLLRLLVIRGSAAPGSSYFIESSDNQGEIANRVGGARQRVNGILKEWERSGVICIEKHGLLIQKPEYLLTLARDSGFDVETYLGAWQGGWKSPFQIDSGFSAAE